MVSGPYARYTLTMFGVASLELRILPRGPFCTRARHFVCLEWKALLARLQRLHFLRRHTARLLCARNSRTHWRLVQLLFSLVKTDCEGRTRRDPGVGPAFARRGIENG